MRVSEAQDIYLLESLDRHLRFVRGQFGEKLSDQSVVNIIDELLRRTETPRHIRRCHLQILGKYFSVGKEFQLRDLKFEFGEKSEFIINKVIEEWEMRSWGLAELIDRSRPTPGVLKALDYKVGKRGSPLDIRKLLIDYAVSAVWLPPVKDQAYMAEWGEPMTLKRYHKIRRTLEKFVSQHENNELMRTAVQHWKTDLKYLHKTWGYLER